MAWLAVLTSGDAGLRIDVVHGDGHSLRVIDAGGCSLMLSGDFAADIASPPVEAQASWLLDAYRHAGADVFRRLRGRFAFALLDHSENAAFVVRDPMGAHPLFYAAAEGAVHFGPVAETVARRDGKRPALNQIAGAAFLARTPIDGRETLFAGVLRLLQGHVLEVRPSGLGVRRYWTPPPAGSTSYEPRRFEHVLGRAVDRAVAGRTGVFLSGGLDSAVVAAALADRVDARGLPKPVALSLAFRGTPANEEPAQREIAGRLGFEQIVCTPSELVPGGLLDAALTLGAGPLGRPAELLDGAYDELAKRGQAAGCSTIIGGSGGDEWLMPPTGFAADRLLMLDARALADLIRASHGYWPSLGWAAAAWFVLWGSAMRPLGRSLLSTVTHRLSTDVFTRARRERAEARIPQWVAPAKDVRTALVERILAETTPEPLGNAASTERQRFLDSGNLSVAQEHSSDLAMRTGVTSSSPLLDPDVVEFLCSIEFHALTARGRAKAPARDLLVSRLPDLADTWPRTVYGNALWTDTLRRDGAHAWNRASGAPAIVATGLVEPRRLESVLRGEVPASPVELGAAWRALSLDSWLRGIADRRDAV